MKKQVVMDIKVIRKALGTSTKAVKDECGDWNLFGKKGKVYHDHIYWYACVGNYRSILKKELSFMTLWQGDTVFRSDKLPSIKEAALIRRILGLGKKRILSPEQKAKLAEGSKKFRFKPRGTEAV